VDRHPVRNMADYADLVAKTDPERGAMLYVLSARTGRARFVLIRGE